MVRINEFYEDVQAEELMPMAALYCPIAMEICQAPHDECSLCRFMLRDGAGYEVSDGIHCMPF